MLTIQITDTDLEQRIVERAKAIGKSVQQLAQELLSNQLIDSDEELGFEVPRLDVRQHARTYTPEISAEEEAELAKNPDVKLFAHVTDTVAFAKQLRNNSWKRK